MKTTHDYSDERILNQIHVIRGHKVMVDSDLAVLYGVETKRLKEQVRRNMDRFPDDFMFEMTDIELENWRSQIATSNALRHSPFCFTEQGVTMLACVLNSERAIQMNIRIIRLFTKMREAIFNHKELLLKMETIERKVMDHDESLVVILESIKELLQREEIRIRTNEIGYRKPRG
jgi:hypothetical protein